MPTPQMTTSAAGRAFLRREEGCVLRAYRDVTGTWTIGDGLTAASGVIVPKAGMVISQAEADRLFILALSRNYEPAVRAAMPTAAQHEFDAAVSFHWNTGAIRSASWVGLWKARQWVQVQTALLAWCKSKGKVIPALTARRQREFQLLRHGYYTAAPLASAPPTGTWAVISSAISSEQVQEVRAALVRLGYAVGSDPDRILRSALTDFQCDHDLTVDGILGRATLATIRRMLAARTATARTAGIGGGAMVNAGVSGAPLWFDLAVLAGAAGIGLVAAWSYRDAIAAAVQSRIPRLAAFLRRF